MGAVILLVDDDPNVRRTIRLMLECGGHMVLAAASGREALAALAALERPVQALITDQNMPEMSGSELVSILHERGIALPVLFISGQPLAELAGQEDAVPPRGFLAKPFTQAALLAELAALVQGARARP